jgi:hypothetical protein
MGINRQDRCCDPAPQFYQNSFQLAQLLEGILISAQLKEE